MKHKISSVRWGLAHLVLVVLSATTIAGCSGGLGSNEDAKAQQQKDAKTLQELYSGVQGRWEGVVSNSKIGLEPFRAELKLYVYYIQDGTNPDGSVKLRPTLRGKFQPLDFVTETDVMTLNGDFQRNGELTMTAQTAASGTMTETYRMLSVHGLAAGGKANLEITREGGVWGYFEGDRVSTDSSASVSGELAEYRARYLRINGPYEGRYFGTMKSVNGNDYRVEIAMVIVEGTNGYPALAAQYKRLDAPPGTLEWALAVTFNSQTGAISMRENALTGGGGVPGGMILSVTGNLKTVNGKKVMNVSVRNRSAVLGTLEAIRN